MDKQKASGMVWKIAILALLGAAVIAGAKLVDGLKSGVGKVG